MFINNIFTSPLVFKGEGHGGVYFGGDDWLR